MNSPRQPDGPPIRDGKPYSALVHLAEDVTPFVAVAAALRERSLSAPAIYAFDLDRGFLILEDLGDRVFGAEIAKRHDMAELWAGAVDVLLALAEAPPPERLPIEGHAPYRLPDFDADAMLTEASLLIDWFWPALHGKEMPQSLARRVHGAVAPFARRRGKVGSRLGVARLSLPQLNVAAQARGREAGWTPGLPGCP